MNDGRAKNLMKKGITMKRRNWFWGIFFLFSAIFVFASQVALFKEIGAISIAATVLLTALIIESIFHRNFFGIFIPLAFMYMIYQEPLLPYIGMKLSIWMLLLAAVLVGIGFSILFPKKPKSKTVCCNDIDGKFNYFSDSMNGNRVFAKESFGASCKYLHSDSLESGHFQVSFGAMEVYFDQAQLSPEGAEILLEVSFGAIELYIPRHWNAFTDIHTSLAGVENDNRYNKADPDSPKLTIKGNVYLGGVEIHYV